VSGGEPPELRPAELLAALLERGVRFLVVGGVGAQLHGATRATLDLDVCIDWDRENFKRIAGALDDLGAVLDLPAEASDIEVRPSAELIGRMSMTRWRTSAGVVDVMHDIAAGEDGRRIPFGQLERRAVLVRGADTPVPVAALDDIIVSKENAGRDKDREALPELYELRRHLQGEVQENHE